MQRGFSLVELSIVLVILGLLTGGILAGQSLIKASELRAVSTEATRYITAIHSFRDKYLQVPGDFRDATRFWARLNTNGDCVSNHGLGTAGSPGVCDGDGDGLMEGAGAGGQSGEQFQIWRHMALAGLIEGTYSGLAGASAASHTTGGTNIPTSRFNQGGWITYTDPTVAAGTETFAGSYGSWIGIGRWAGGTLAPPRYPLFKPEEAWNIDMKMDDGRPATGKVIPRFWDTCTTATSGSDTTGSYDLALTSVECTLYFAQAY